MRLYSLNKTDLDLLERVFEGNVYKHLKTWVWTIAKRKNLLYIAEEVLPYWDEEQNPNLILLFDWYFEQRGNRLRRLRREGRLAASLD